jgi:PPOX class probable F420-dependent enzyme
MIPEEHRPFLESHSLAIVGFVRKSGPPSLSPVYYIVDGDAIVFSTTTQRGKGRAVARTGELTLCIIDTNPPFPYLTVYGTATSDETTAVDTMMKIGQVMTGNPLPEAARGAMQQRAETEGRVSVRVTPTEFFSTRPIGSQQPTKG